VLIACLALTAAAPLVSRDRPEAIDPSAALSGPSRGHWFGTDELGRDLLARLLYGGRASLALASASVAVSVLVGVPSGLFAGYYGGVWDGAVMRVADFLLAFPAVLLAIIFVTFLGPGLLSAMIAIGVARFPVFCRLSRASIVATRSREFVEAARGIGCRDARVVVRHLLPNAMDPLVVQTALTFGQAILTGAALGFLGLGAQPPTPEWGAMVGRGRLYLQSAAYVSLFPGLAIAVVAVAANVLGDALRDMLDPRLRHG
jgi:ABC-type dipeptide/oligopeptide/nickel transport system permease subunit